jgi:hypothetical protein
MILRERFPTVDEDVLNLPPIRLETLLDSCYKEEVEGGYDVPIPLPYMQILLAIDFLI